jgi:hypothetical protein
VETPEPLPNLTAGQAEVMRPLRRKPRLFPYLGDTLQKSLEVGEVGLLGLCQSKCTGW